MFTLQRPRFDVSQRGACTRRFSGLFARQSCKMPRCRDGEMMHRSASRRRLLALPHHMKEYLPNESTMPEKVSRLPRLRVVGQLSQSYIVTEGPDGMYLIDQHAAHERILLEKMVAALQARTPISQLLLTPISLTAAPDELEAIEERLQQLEQIGFTLEIREDNSIQVRAVPNVLVKEMN